MSEAQKLGFLDLKTMGIDAASGALFGAFTPKIDAVFRKILRVPTSAATKQISDGVARVTYQLQLGKSGIWTVQYGDTVLTVEAGTMEKILRAAAMGAYSTAEQLMLEALQQAAAEKAKGNNP